MCEYVCLCVCVCDSVSVIEKERECVCESVREPRHEVTKDKKSKGRKKRRVEREEGNPIITLR